MRAELEVLHSTYAEALFEYGEEKNLLDRFIEDFEIAASIFKNERSLLKIIKDPRIGLEDKENLLGEIDKKTKFSEEFLNFMKLLVNRKRFGIFHGIFLKFRDMYDAARGRVKVFLHSSVQLDRDEINKVRDILKMRLKKEIIIEEKKDETLIGGIRIQCGGRIYDGSVKKDLEYLKERVLL